MYSAYQTGNLCPFERKVVRKLLINSTVEIVVVGGSNTAGHDLEDSVNERWSTVFTNFINDAIDASFNVDNIAVAAYDTNMWITSLHEKPFHTADLIILDLSINDQTVHDLSHLPSVYKNFIEELNKLPNHPAILSLQTFRTSNTSTDDINKHCPNPKHYGYCCGEDSNRYWYCRRWWMQQDFTTPTLQNAGVQYVSYRDLVWPLYSSPPSNLPKFWKGLSHVDAKGHRLLGKLVAFGFMSMINESMQLVEDCDRDYNSESSLSTIPTSIAQKLSKSTCYYSESCEDIDNRNKTSICSQPLSILRATESIESFLPADMPNVWEYKSDSRDKYGWILETNVSFITQLCLSDQSPSPICEKAVDLHSILFRIEIGNSNPILKIHFLKSFSVKMGAIILRIGNDTSRKDNIIHIDGKWDQHYSVTQVITLIGNISSLVGCYQNDVVVLPYLQTLLPGTHEVFFSIPSHHIQILNPGGHLKFKLLGIMSC